MSDPALTDPALTAEQRFVSLLRERFGLAVDAEPPPEGFVLAREQHVELARTLKALGYTSYLYVVASHWLATAAKGAVPADPEHYEVATGLRTVGAGTHVARWRVRLEMDQPLDSLVPLFAGADWQEREQYDLLGVVFAGHPDLRRLMMPEEWVGHPLRKDYAIETGHLPWR